MNKKGFTIVELIVSFSLTMIVMIYLLKTIVVISNKERELLTLQEYTVVETNLLNTIYEDIKELNPSEVSIIKSDDSILIDGVGYVSFNKDDNSIIYKDVIYELPEGVKLDFGSDGLPFSVGNIKDATMISENTSFDIAKINLMVNNQPKFLKIVHQKYLEGPASSTDKKICKRASTLHTEICSQTDTNLYCSGAGYTASGSKGTTTITYGNDPATRTAKTLTSGDAFDCDVNGDGTYDSATERFYYVTDLEENNNVAVLMYYNNVSGGGANNTIASAYDSTHGDISSSQNWYGPITAITNLPTNSQWKNVNLTNEVRTIKYGNGTSTNGENTLPSNFSYGGYVARLLTAQEVNKTCGITIGSFNVGELDKCNYLMENTKYSSSSMGTYGYWLENPLASDSHYAWFLSGDYRYGYFNNVSYAGLCGSRPAIEVPKSDISY